MKDLIFRSWEFTRFDYFFFVIKICISNLSKLMNKINIPHFLSPPPPHTHKINLVNLYCCFSGFELDTELEFQCHGWWLWYMSKKSRVHNPGSKQLVVGASCWETTHNLINLNFFLLSKNLVSSLARSTATVAVVCCLSLVVLGFDPIDYFLERSTRKRALTSKSIDWLIYYESYPRLSVERNNINKRKIYIY